MEALAGETRILTSAGGETVKTDCPPTEPEVAMIVVVPSAAVDASPPGPIVADVVLEVHVAVGVRFCCVPSVKFPVAVNCTDKPSGTEVLAGVTVIEVSAAALTVRTVDPLMDPEVAVMVVVPWEALEAKPVLLMGATVAAEEVQVAVAVRSAFVPSA